MKIAKIVSSNSHIDYIARIIDSVDAGDELPHASDYCFAQFVAIAGDGEDVIGVTYDSRLVNPDYGSFGPRTGPRAELGRHNADYVQEPGILVGILLLGTIDESGKTFHGVPRKIVRVDQPVTKLDAERVTQFHTDGSGHLHLHYYPQVVSNARQFALPLLDAIIDQLASACTDSEGQRLRVLKQSLIWQGTFGGMKL